ncbi:MAG: VOC family protein [Bacteroidales bacterium]
MHIDHIAIWTKDLESEKDFFLRYFKCSVNDKYYNQGKRFTSYFITFEGGGKIELMKRPEISKKLHGTNLGFTHMAVHVGSRANVLSLTEKFLKDGVEVLNLPRETGDGYYESVILDPEGNRIEIMSL